MTLTDQQIHSLLQAKKKVRIELRYALNYLATSQQNHSEKSPNHDADYNQSTECVYCDRITHSKKTVIILRESLKEIEEEISNVLKKIK